MIDINNVIKTVNNMTGSDVICLFDPTFRAIKMTIWFEIDSKNTYKAYYFPVEELEKINLDPVEVILERLYEERRKFMKLKNTCYITSDTFRYTGVEGFRFEPKRTKEALDNALDAYRYLFKVSDFPAKKNFKTFTIPFTEIPSIKNVIFNYPATIVFWSDGTKTVVKCGEGDKFDKEKGLAMAMSKKIFGTNISGSNYYDIFKKWCSDKEVK